MAPRRSTATTKIQPAVRCAVYCRKSTEAGLDQAFNSLHNQREAAEAYIASQRHENWIALNDDYSDGGFSGGNTDRPALKRLLADVDAGRLDIIVVYKLDRLSRSLLDFLNLHRSLEARGVQIVSVTEPIDTRTPIGRTFVSVLVSFGQMEREVAGERTAHKIRAARRRGRWTGGMPPLGYDVVPEGGKLTVNEDEAAMVRQIFELYIVSPSLVELAAILNHRGWRNKTWTTKSGNHRQGGPWNRVSLSRLLKDPRYTGVQTLGNEVFPGEHRGIVPKALFDRVQRLLGKNLRDRGASARNRHGALLRGLLRCSGCDRAMTHAPTKKDGRAYRYYRCQGAQKNGAAGCPTRSVNADRVEQFVVDQIRRIGADPALQDETFRQAVDQVKAQRRGLQLETKRLKAELTRSRADVQRLVETVSRLTGPAADATAAELGAAQERVARMAARQGEIVAEVATLDPQAIDRAELTRALEAFDPIWDVLLTPEKERVLGLLIEQIGYDGSELTIHWRLAGFGELAAEVAP